MNRHLTWAATLLTLISLVAVTRGGFEVTRRGSDLFGPTRTISFQERDAHTLDQAQRQVRSGPLRVMGAVAETALSGATAASPSGALDVGVTGGGQLAQLTEAGVRRWRERPASAQRAEALASLRGSAASPRPLPTRPPPAGPADRDAIVGTWNGSVTVPSTGHPARETVEPVRLRAHAASGQYQCTLEVTGEHAKEATVERFRVAHVGGQRYTGRFDRTYEQPDMDWREDVDVTVELRVEGHLLRGALRMRTTRRVGERVTRETATWRLELMR